MRPGFSTINIIIILGLILLAYLGYTQYLDDKIKQDLAKPINFHQNAVPTPEPLSQKKSTDKNQTVAKKTAAKAAPAPELKAPAPAGEKDPAARPGYYRNYTYFYEISFPESWPTRVRSAGNVSFGTVPPKNGQGAITVEVTQGENNELDQAKAEAKKYAGLVSITEEPIILAGMSGDKITMNNFMAKTKTINILIKKSGLNYLIKYSEESPEFVSQVNQALTTFKFTK